MLQRCDRTTKHSYLMLARFHTNPEVEFGFARMLVMVSKRTEALLMCLRRCHSSIGHGLGGPIIRIFTKISYTFRLSFVKHNRKGVLKSIGVEICTHYPPLPYPGCDRFKYGNIRDHDRYSHEIELYFWDFMKDD